MVGPAHPSLALIAGQFINEPSPPINMMATIIFKYNYLIYTELMRNTGLWSTTDKWKNIRYKYIKYKKI